MANIQNVCVISAYVLDFFDCHELFSMLMLQKHKKKSTRTSLSGKGFIYRFFIANGFFPALC